MFAHFFWLVFAVENGQLGKHAHVRTFQPQSRFKQRDKLFKVPSMLVIVVQLLQFVGMNDNV